MAAQNAELVSYSPHPHYMLSMMRANLPWWKALGELVDNAFDHSATRVVIASTAKQIEVQDDGTGIKSIVSAIKLGDHQPSEATALGMYGVGLKDAWLSIGDQIEIVTIHRGVESSVNLSVHDFMPPDWKAPAPTSKEVCTASGTTIRIHLRPRKHRPAPDVWAMLAWVFTPALKQGKQILRRDGNKKSPLAPVDLPPLLDRIADSFDVDGKQVSIDIGIVAENQTVHRGPFWIQYGHRIICNSSIGAGGYSTLRIAGVIVLGKGWSLTKNKDDLADFSDELADAIETRIKPLLEKAQLLSEEIESSALKLELEGTLNNAIAEAKREKRESTRETVGTVLRKETGRKRKQAEKIHEDKCGSVEIAGPSCKRRGIQFGWAYLDEGIAGQFDPLAKRVDLNIRHPFVSAAKKAVNTLALQSIAVSVLSHYLAMHKDSEKTLFEINDFNQCFGTILQSIKVNDANSSK